MKIPHMCCESINAHGLILLPTRDQQGEIWQMGGHCPLRETGKWKMMLPELGLNNCVMLIMSSLKRK